MTEPEFAQRLIASRRLLVSDMDRQRTLQKAEAEGGCGVIGIACSEKIAARHLLQALIQMRNRGNSKGGGIAAVGLIPEELGVTKEVLEKDYLLNVAYLNPSCRQEVEKGYIEPTFEVHHVRHAHQIDDYRAIKGLDVKPPEVYMYFVRVKPEVLFEFKKTHNVAGSDSSIEDEIVFEKA